METQKEIVTAEMIAETHKEVLQGILNIAQQSLEKYLHNNGFAGHDVVLSLEVLKSEPVTNEKD